MDNPSSKPKARGRYMALALILLLLLVLGWFVLSPRAVTLTPEREAYPAGTGSIACTWRNGTLRSIGYSNPYTLERLEGETWREVPVNLFFELPLYRLPPLVGRRQMTYLLDTALKPGQYRICAQFYLASGRTPHTAYAPFTLTP